MARHSIHFENQINNLKKMLLSEGALVEESVRDALKAFNARNSELARQVVQGDEKIDQLEVELEEECLAQLRR